jgi:hypothetical protein
MERKEENENKLSVEGGNYFPSLSNILTKDKGLVVSVIFYILVFKF